MQVLTTDVLFKLGFVDIGKWERDNERISYGLADERARNLISKTNALYAFVIDNEVQYIGKTSRSIKQRFTGYCSPGYSQQTNIRCNEKIRDAHAQQIEVRILIFIPTSNLNYGDFQINLAAGLEDNLIRRFEPPWNVIAGRKRISEETERERAEEPRVKAIVNPKVQEPVSESALNTKYGPYYICLGKTYYNKGFINLGVGESQVSWEGWRADATSF